jgi:hypothetical protein
VKQNYSLDEYIVLEQNIVNDLLVFFNNKNDFSKIIYTEWTAKDVLAHIVMWHESFANNIMAIIDETEPKLLKGLLCEINENGVKEYKEYSIDELLKKIINAQEIINNNIKNKRIGLIPYRKNSKRIYTKEKHLEIVYRHIQEHYKDIIKKYK